MKKVLVIAFYFPPLGGGGVQRPLKFVRYLKEYGWEPIVLTIKPYLFKYLRDPSLLKEISDIKIYRAPFFNLKGLPLMRGTPGKLFYKPIDKKYLVPGFEVLWNYFAVKKALSIIKKEKIDLIFTTLPPYCINLIGKKLKNTTHLPWVCDLRDEWTTDENRKSHFQAMKKNRLRTEVNMERESLNASDRIVIISDVAAKKISQAHNINSAKIDVIYNGYDSNDYSGYNFSFPVKGEKLRILHAGNLSTRDFGPFLKAIKNLVDTKKIDSANVEILFRTSSAKKNILKHYDSEIIKFAPYLEHKNALLEMAKSHILLLSIRMDEPATISGKIFEYLYSKRIVFAVAPKHGVAADIIKKCNAGLVSSPDNIEEIEENLLNLYKQWEEDKLVYTGKEEEIVKFDRKLLTGQLADSFNKVLE